MRGKIVISSPSSSIFTQVTLSPESDEPQPPATRFHHETDPNRTPIDWQCCTAAVRFLVEADLRKNVKQLPSNHHRRLNVESRINRTSSFKPKQSSILQKASGVVIKVFKHLKHGFWKKHDRRHNNEVKRLKSFADLLCEKEITPPLSPSASPVSTAVPIAAAAELTSSTSNSISWSDSDFTAATGSFTAGNYVV
ncbi:hypothetical protein R6Q57_012571 [Mikania cordata]